MTRTQLTVPEMVTQAHISSYTWMPSLSLQVYMCILRKTYKLQRMAVVYPLLHYRPMAQRGQDLGLATATQMCVCCCFVVVNFPHHIYIPTAEETGGVKQLHSRETRRQKYLMPSSYVYTLFYRPYHGF